MTDEERKELVFDVKAKLTDIGHIAWMAYDKREKPSDREDCLRLLTEATELVKKIYGGDTRSGVTSPMTATEVANMSSTEALALAIGETARTCERIEQALRRLPGNSAL